MKYILENALYYDQWQWKTEIQALRSPKDDIGIDLSFTRQMQQNLQISNLSKFGEISVA